VANHHSGATLSNTLGTAYANCRWSTPPIAGAPGSNCSDHSMHDSCSWVSILAKFSKVCKTTQKFASNILQIFGLLHNRRR
jgi:hypothetical protein